jgi:hypothetical protein
MVFTIRDDRFPAVNYKPGMPVYIRFGRWSLRSHNAATREAEAGVSVYLAWIKDRVVYLDPSVLCPSLRGQGRLVFPVTGKLVGIGSDGEPVLRQVKVLAGVSVSLDAIPREFRPVPRA